ncbi:MAG: NAD-dependent deacylase [Candidatus Thorarchaeota archaeon]|nr:NAD-dependent deacylase [Candidatus Thorarchaeota archaeon]
MDELSIQLAAKMIDDSEYLVALTGAGISRESNIPTFRGEDGLWRNYNAMELATPEAYANDPELVWEWYTWRHGLIRDCTPNPAHMTIAKWEKDGVLKHLITQNVDDLHYRAGSRKLTHVHGDIFGLKCTRCGYKSRLNEPSEDIPECPECYANLRPDVVWFGESLDAQVMNTVYDQLERADTIIVIGTSGIVQPAASFPLVVKNQGGSMIEINVERTALSNMADMLVSGKAGEVLPLIDQHLL